MKKSISKILSIITIILFTFTIVILVTGTIAMKKGKPLSIFGYTYSVVPSDSMEPEIHVGDFILAKQVPWEEIQIGDDVIYYSEMNEIYIIHRVLEADGEDYVMKGINNPASDPERLTKENYVAKRIWNGSILNFGKITSQYRWVIFLALILIFGFIFVNETVNIINLLKKKKEEEEKEKLLKDIEAEVRKEIEEEKNQKAKL